MGKEDTSLNDTLDSSKESDLMADFDSDFETNFNAAMKMSIEKYDYVELIKFLRSEKIVEKQIAILELDEIKSKNDALILVSNLIGQDGKIREAVAFKVNELIKNPSYIDFFIDEKVFDVLLQGIMDINGNVCRQIVDLGGKWGENEAFGLYLCEKLPKRVNEILIEIKKIDMASKQYVISKRNFQLYWCLEALYNIIDIVNFDEIKEILFATGVFYDYTIREKTAKILTKIDNFEFDKFKEKLKIDENYYVRRYLISEK